MTLAEDLFEVLRKHNFLVPKDADMLVIRTGVSARDHEQPVYALSAGDSFRLLARTCYDAARAKGFWDSARVPAETIALCHSELSELLEAFRKPGPDEHLPGFSKVEVELADCIIRLFDFAGRLISEGYPVDQAFIEKFMFNQSRPQKHGKLF
jgi:NTP pyrophosphatase (non-canonical NTP hydrolase)